MNSVSTSVISQGILMAGFYPMLCWSGLYFGIKYYQMLQEETAKVLRVSAMAHEGTAEDVALSAEPTFPVQHLERDSLR